MSNLFVVKRAAALLMSLSLITTSATVSLVVTADVAMANNGNGNGGGNANRGNNGRSENSSSARRSSRNSAAASNRNNGNSNGNRGANNGNAGRGSAIASELKSLNAAHASPNALANAAPGSMPGMLRDYRDTFRGLIVAVEKQNIAYQEYVRLAEMSESAIASTYPNGGHAQALADAAATYNALRHDAATSQAQNQAILQRITSGRTLSNAAMEELHAMLGL